MGSRNGRGQGVVGSKGGDPEVVGFKGWWGLGVVGVKGW